MTRLTRPAAIFLLVAAFTLPALADKAKSLYKEGQDAEARQNYEQRAQAAQGVVEGSDKN